MQTTLTVTHLRLLAKSHCVQEAACRDAKKMIIKMWKRGILRMEISVLNIVL